MWLVCIVSKDNKQVRLCCNAVNSLECEDMDGNFFSFLQGLHEIEKNAVWKQEQTALKEPGVAEE